MAKALIRNPGLSISPSQIHGFGVFTNAPIAAGEILEECPVLLVDEAHCPPPDGSNLSSYLFRWKPGTKQLAVVLGSGSLFNHSATPNARYEKSFSDKLVRFIATCPIESGEEIFLNFLQDSPGGKLWFSDVHGHSSAT